MFLFAVVSCSNESKYETKNAESNGYTYQYVTNDPFNVRIYTLKNGLKVYLSQYQAEPRLQTQIAVKAGGKNDPATTTGLAHYLEHIMFKGSTDFGTLNWQKEKVLIDSIEHMFEHYRTLTDSMARVKYYKLIDNVSNEASKLAIANEYDKMVAEIGAKGTNAYTTEDRTVYVNDIPANQLENWIRIEANRFKSIVPRLFHTELETVYEEKNRSLDNDYWKTYEALNASLFTRHPYGTQTVIGTVDHLKNPSITNIKNYFNTYYRPNNVAICLSGDLDYDKTIALINKYFGSWQPNTQLPTWQKIDEDPVEKPIIKEIYGPDAEWVVLGFRFSNGNADEAKLLKLTDMILANAQAGLIDINLIQKQKVLKANSYIYDMNDYSIHTFMANPREGQKLEQVKDLLLGQIEHLKSGAFDDWLPQAVINNLKKNRIEQSQSNEQRCNTLVMSFTTDTDWQTYVSEIDDLRKFTKNDIVKFAQKHYRYNYAAIYKRHGKDLTITKVVKPAITRVALNKESKSPFHQALINSKPERLKPVYVDYKKDIARLTMHKGLEVLYTPNTENELFSLYYLSEVGTDNDARLKMAIDYLQYLGTDELSAEDFKKELYKLGCNVGVNAGTDQTYVYLTGLHENMDKAMYLFESLLTKPKADNKALKDMIDGEFKSRDDMKKDKHAILFQGLRNYGLYGAESSFTNVLTNKQLRALSADELTAIIRGFTKTHHKVLYYGPGKADKIISLLTKSHMLPDTLKPAPARVAFQMKEMKKPVVYWVNYDMVQAEIMFLAKGPVFAKERVPMIEMFNEYFDGNMSSPVFQELREAQGLAYAAFAYYGKAKRYGSNDFFYSYIGTQADKQVESMRALSGLIRQLPGTESGFSAAKEGLMNRIESERITKADMLFDYLHAQRMGIAYDVRRDVYDNIQTMTLDNIRKFHAQYLQNATYNTVLIGSRDKLNLNDLKRYGEVKELTLDELFGYEKAGRLTVYRLNQ